MIFYSITKKLLKSRQFVIANFTLHPPSDDFETFNSACARACGEKVVNSRLLSHGKNFISSN